MKIIAVGLTKGGVGKTTTAINLAAGLAKVGYKTLLVDLDTQGSVAKSLGINFSNSLTEALMEEKTAPQECIVKVRDNFDVLPSDRSLTRVKLFITSLELGRESYLKQRLRAIEGYSYVFLDCATAWDILNLNALFYATDIFIPVSMDHLSLVGLSEYQESVAAVRQYNPELEIVLYIPTFFDQREGKSWEVLEVLQKHYKEKVAEPIRKNVKLSEAPSHFKTIFEYSARSYGAKDYTKLVEKVVSIYAKEKKPQAGVRRLS